MSSIPSTCHECRNEQQLSPLEVFAVTFIQWLGGGSLARLVRTGVVEIVVDHPPEADEPHSGPNITRVDCEAWDHTINGPLHTFWDELWQADRANRDRRTR